MSWTVSLDEKDRQAWTQETQAKGSDQKVHTENLYPYYPILLLNGRAHNLD